MVDVIVLLWSMRGWSKFEGKMMISFSFKEIDKIWIYVKWWSNNQWIRLIDDWCYFKSFFKLPSSRFWCWIWVWQWFWFWCWCWYLILDFRLARLFQPSLSSIKYSSLIGGGWRKIWRRFDQVSLAHTHKTKLDQASQGGRLLRFFDDQGILTNWGMRQDVYHYTLVIESHTSKREGSER